MRLREPLIRQAAERLGREDTTMNEDKQCLQRDTIEGRCLEEGCRKTMLDVSCGHTRCDEYVVMVKTGNECQPQPTCRHT